MKTKPEIVSMTLMALLSSLITAAAQGSAFTYQAQLTDGSNPANGLYDFRFSVMESPELGVPLDLRITNGVPVNDGLFTVTLDFGGELFDGSPRWLEIEVKTNNAASPYTLLSPRQELTAAPYAILAGSISGLLPGTGLSGDYSSPVALENVSNLFTGNFTGNGGGLTNVNAGTLEGLSAADFWRVSGNADTSPGQFLGTADNQALDLRVNNTRALRLQPTAGAPNVVGGAEDNVVGEGVTGATICGGQGNHVTAQYGTVGGGVVNYATASTATVGGGSSNQATDESATVAGGSANAAQGRGATVGGGMQNTILPIAAYGTIGGGIRNMVYREAATVAGGRANEITGAADAATIGGGESNRIGSAYGAVIAGGHHNEMDDNSNGSVISGGGSNDIDSGTSYATIAGGSSNVIRTASLGVIAGGGLNRLGGGSWRAFIGGGYSNRIESGGAASVIAGGEANAILESSHNVICGGVSNRIWSGGGGSMVGGGQFNKLAGSESATIGGGQHNSIGNNSDYGTIDGGYTNTIENFASFATIGGGSDNTVQYSAYWSTIGGGEANTIGEGAEHATVGGGAGNFINVGADWSTIGGGQENGIGLGADWSAIGGGRHNNIASDAWYAAIGGGWQNNATNKYGFVGGGRWNIAGGLTSMVPGGQANTASGDYSFAAGRRAKALHEGSFVWADGNDQDLGSSAANQYTARATGGVRFISSISPTTNGVQLAAGAASWSSLSDRNVKENFAVLDAREVLEKVAALPITTWNLKSQPDAIRHIGPMAQDFAVAFGVGEDDRHINCSDADGVALAAIQGLNRKLTEELQRRDAENAQLKLRLERVERLLSQRTGAGQ